MIHPVTKKQYITIYPKMLTHPDKANYCSYCDLNPLGYNCKMVCVNAKDRKGCYHPIYKEMPESESK